MATSEGSAHSQWRRFFAGAGGADIFEIIDAAVAVAALDQPVELEQRRERIARKLYTEGILSCGDAATPLKGCRSVAVSNKEDRSPASSAAEKATAPVKTRLPMAASKKEEGPSRSSEEKATAPVKNLSRKNCSARPHSTTPPAADLDRKKAATLTQPTEQSMEAMLATAKRRLKEGYEECKEAKRQRKTQLVEAPEMAKQRRKRQHPIMRRRDEVRCVATIAQKRALMSTLRASWA